MATASYSTDPFPAPRPMMHDPSPYYSSLMSQHDITPQPVPTSAIPDYFEPDDALSLTPEKPHKRRSREKPNHLRSSRVRFDDTVEVKTMSPDRQSDDLNVSVTAPKTYSYQTEPDDDAIVSVRASDHRPTPSVPDHVLARPEFNATLRVGKKLQKTSHSELDLSEAVRQKLSSSQRTKTAIVEKATSRVNSLADQFEELVSVDVQEPDLINAVCRAKTEKAPPQVHSRTARLQDTDVPPPDILSCLTPDMLSETPCLTLTGLRHPDNAPQTAPLGRAFDVYRRIRAWEEW